MKQITLSVPDEKYEFLMELLNSIDFVSMEGFPTIPEQHKNLIRERIRTSSPEQLLKWDEIKDDFSSIK